MDVNQTTKVIDEVYKNISDNFNPASKQIVATGKAYLKSLHGASAACAMYLDALMKFSRLAHNSPGGSSSDIGNSLLEIADVFKEIHTHQLIMLKAFYVDYLVPIEINLEKDVKVIQAEQKEFLSSHKHRVESYNKAVSNAKKIRKKSSKTFNPSSHILDKEIRVMQTMEEERSKLETFCNEALGQVLIQQRRRFGFVLERQASLAKHYQSFYHKGGESLGSDLEKWIKIGKSREVLPEETLQVNLVKKQGDEECIYCNPGRPVDDTSSISLPEPPFANADNTISLKSSITTSFDGFKGCKYPRAVRDTGTQSHADLKNGLGAILSKAKSDTSLGTLGCSNNSRDRESTSSCQSIHYRKMDKQLSQNISFLPKLAVAKHTAHAIGTNCANDIICVNRSGLAKALYTYQGEGDNQLSFMEGDIIALISDSDKGWQFGENLRCHKTGWFPVGYTKSCQNKVDGQIATHQADENNLPLPIYEPPLNPKANKGDGYVLQQATIQTQTNQQRLDETAKAEKSIPVPSEQTDNSLHSNNDSGFSNEASRAHHRYSPDLCETQFPTELQPEIDYSDEEKPKNSSSDREPSDNWGKEFDHTLEPEDKIYSTNCAKSSFENVSNSFNDKLNKPKNIASCGSVNPYETWNTSRRLNYFSPSIQFNEESKTGGTVLKHFLRRTKSFILGLPSNQQNIRKAKPAIAFTPTLPSRVYESSLCTDTSSDLWESHSSIVEMYELEMKNPSVSNPFNKLNNNNFPKYLDEHVCLEKYKNKDDRQKRNENNTLDKSAPRLPPRNVPVSNSVPSLCESSLSKTPQMEELPQDCGKNQTPKNTKDDQTPKNTIITNRFAQIVPESSICKQNLPAFDKPNESEKIDFKFVTEKEDIGTYRGEIKLWNIHRLVYSASNTDNNFEMENEDNFYTKNDTKINNIIKNESVSVFKPDLQESEPEPFFQNNRKFETGQRLSPRKSETINGKPGAGSKQGKASSSTVLQRSVSGIWMSRYMDSVNMQKRHGGFNRDNFENLQPN